jgi:hypothetical protein
MTYEQLIVGALRQVYGKKKKAKKEAPQKEEVIKVE